jgi:hypothetical protein
LLLDGRRRRRVGGRLGANEVQDLVDRVRLVAESHESADELFDGAFLVLDGRLEAAHVVERGHDRRGVGHAGGLLEDLAVRSAPRGDRVLHRPEAGLDDRHGQGALVRGRHAVFRDLDAGVLREDFIGFLEVIHRSATP